MVYHQSNAVTKVVPPSKELLVVDKNKSIAQSILFFASQFPNSKIVWCHDSLEDNLNLNEISSLFHHNKMMLSYGLEQTNFLGNSIGYVEESPFININKKVRYPSWLMSVDVGVIHASVINHISKKIQLDKKFDYFLNSVAKLGMFYGLFCYSEPQLLVNKTTEIKLTKASSYELFRFVKQHYKKRWSVLLFLNLLVFEKRFLILPFLFSWGYRSRKKPLLNFDVIPVQSTLKVVEKKTIDVIIPTIGRKKYLYNVLQDLAKQTHLPVNVIIAEQNPQQGSVSELDYLTSEKWPFTIKHTFTHQAGACNARNVALGQVESEWVFLADDDIVFDPSFFEKAIALAQQYQVSVFTTSCLLVNQKQEYTLIHQSGIFGSGNSFVKTASLQKIRFDEALEFGYGEDTDFGMQLRNQGHDVIYFPDLKITHLKAPMGGFRIKVKQLWENEVLLPKPSPTMMYVLLKHYTTQQLRSYKLVLFLKLLKKESVLNYFNFCNSFQKKWVVSQYWANKIKHEK
ncbi:glycosyltransferase family 2 protein [Flavobacterium gillisiae]|uniref:glycosyltransferase family 2 protein n=1 Tax=Flavobacterium gillisiae TaxID=150146 RepID=UPI001FDF0391|nr:glycosyltransferase family A protein [Flavobacterium gillisiae]